MDDLITLAMTLFLSQTNTDISLYILGVEQKKNPFFLKQQTNFVFDFCAQLHVYVIRPAHMLQVNYNNVQECIGWGYWILSSFCFPENAIICLQGTYLSAAALSVLYELVRLLQLQAPPLRFIYLPFAIKHVLNYFLLSISILVFLFYSLLQLNMDISDYTDSFLSRREV